MTFSRLFRMPEALLTVRCKRLNSKFQLLENNLQGVDLNTISKRFWKVL